MRNYIFSIIGAGIVCAVAGCLLDKKTAAGQILKILSGILMAMTIISPLARIQFSDFSDYWNGITAGADSYVEEGRASAQESVRRIIKSQTEAYILDKATRMDLELAVEVELDDSNNSLPCGVIITGQASPYAKEVIGTYIEENLGIAKERQHWK